MDGTCQVDCFVLAGGVLIRFWILMVLDNSHAVAFQGFLEIYRICTSAAANIDEVFNAR